MIDRVRDYRPTRERLWRSDSNAPVGVVRRYRLELCPRAWLVLIVGCLMLEIRIILASNCMDTNLDCKEWALEGMCDNAGDLDMQNWWVHVFGIEFITPTHRMRTSCAYSCGVCREQIIPAKTSSKAPAVRPVARSPSLHRGRSEEL